MPTFTPLAVLRIDGKTNGVSSPRFPAFAERSGTEPDANPCARIPARYSGPGSNSWLPTAIASKRIAAIHCSSGTPR